MKAAAALLAALGSASCTAAPPHSSPNALAVDVRIVTDEAEAAIAILAAAAAGRPIGEEDWQRLFATEGYRRLAEREWAMGRDFEESAFREFLLSGALLGDLPALSVTVASWREADLGASARLALGYLPPGTRLSARLYPVIKPHPNSFVFTGASPPGIFMYVDPAVPRAKLENTLAHELHHIGLSSACEGKSDSERPERLTLAATWASAFGEGLAMLAAAGGPEIHPHAVSAPEEHARWDRDVANFEPDLRHVESFLLDVLEGRLTDPDAVAKTGMSFFGEQGPWYTVGWAMAATIERVFGRERLIAELCDPLRRLATYNEAARARNAEGDNLPLWSPTLVTKLAL